MNNFSISRKEIDAFLKMQSEEMETVSKGVEGYLATAFHRARRLDRVFNYAHFRNRGALAAAHGNEQFREHLQKLKAFNLRPDQDFFDLAYLSGKTEVSSNPGLPAVMAMIFAPEEADQAVAVAIEAAQMATREGASSAHVLVSDRRERVAIYAQAKEPGRVQAMLAASPASAQGGFEIDTYDVVAGFD